MEGELLMSAVELGLTHTFGDLARNLGWAPRGPIPGSPKEAYFKACS